MVSKLKITLFFCIALVFGWLSLVCYNYFFDTAAPSLMLTGINEDNYYSGEVACSVQAKDNYKLLDISIWLDGKPLVQKFKVQKQYCDYGFSIQTKDLKQGSHTLKLIVNDASRAKNQTIKEINFAVDNAPLQAVLLKTDSEFRVFQGRTLHLQFQVNKQLKQASIDILSQRYMCVPESTNSLIYECFVPIKSEEIPNEYPFTIELLDNVGNTLKIHQKFQVVQYPFKKQQLTLNKEKIKTENEIGIPDYQLEKDIQVATEQSPPQKLWHGNFYVPIEMKGISTDFGTIRTTQERGKYPHNAVDLLGTPKSVVWACQDGIVVIKNRYAHSGLTVVIDHGLGVLSMYFHLDSFGPINVGDAIKKGNPIGTIGRTGYASGYHLHFELRINNIAVDPLQWTKQDF
ncbi:MAG TPA: M23 family metallopeptidase [Candidatus Babeliaceae bacterium]|nr:M23 family metallopeptidase [Candidatus Babeliaceae bacterium]